MSKDISKIALSLKPFLKIIGVTLTLLTLFRIALVVWQWERVMETDGLLFVFLQGMRFDIVIAAILLVIPVVITPFAAINQALLSVWSTILRCYFCLLIVLIVFMELATPNFISQFDARPNIIFTEYLIYPKEVFSTLWVAYKPSMLLVGLILPISAKLVWDYLGEREQQTIKVWHAPLVSLILLLVFTMGIRSTLGHRPINPSIVAFSTDLMVNDLVLNSTYSMLYAWYESQRDEKGVETYGEMIAMEMLARVKNTMAIDNFTGEDIPTLHTQVATYPREKPFNVVIILEESLGAEFVGRQGGDPLTPNIDRLSQQGIWFENLYATGTRSARGIEAVITGFTPTPARSVVKLNKSQRNFFTIASLLKREGYDTSFIYGGEAHFDNMQRFFINNGFNRVVDENDFYDPVFKGSWGVSDEDLFLRAHQEFSEYGEEPFFSLVFSSSNHSPFEFPADRITLFDEEQATEKNAAKYADFALGEFFKLARNSNYWENTIFLVVADHNSRVRGANMVPIEYFHIPGFILGGSIEPKIFDRLASQIDLLPTLLSLAGISSTHPAIGYDLTMPGINELPGRAMMQYNSTLAYLQEEDVVIFEKNKPPQQFLYQDKVFIPTNNIDETLIEIALAHSLFGMYMVNNGLYKLPQNQIDTLPL